ncbi:MAG: glycosyltransferase [Chloroflexi bacterium]|nr:glycosyltransferase [Chloroflexota bacterium]
MARDYRVLLVDLAKGFGGAEVRVLTQAGALQGVVQECKVATLQGSVLHARLQEEGLPHEVLTVSRSSPRLLLVLRGLIQRGGYQIVDAHNVQSILWGHLAAVLAGARGRVATIHSDYGREYSGLKGRFYEAVLWLNRRVVRQIINVTEVLQQKSEQAGDGHRSTLIHNAVPVPPHPYEGQNTQLRNELGVTETDFVVGKIARLKPVKGHKYLIEAFTHLSDRPDIKLVIVGDGPLEAELKAQVEALSLQERVVFTGFRTDIPQVMQAVDCVCMASLSEALPYTVLEAASYARPLLVTEVGGLATLLANGETAIMVPARDPQALAEGIRRLVEDPGMARQLGVAAYEMVRDSFSVDVMLESILEVYDQAVQT